MVKIIPARLENGHIVPEAPLPPSGTVRSVSILIDYKEPDRAPDGRSTFEMLHGILKGYQGDPEGDYQRYLEEKYR